MRSLDGWADKWKANSDLLRRELMRYILQRLKHSADISEGNWAANVLAGCGRTTTVISLNYDNIAERILSAVVHVQNATLRRVHTARCANFLKRHVAVQVARRSPRTTVRLSHKATWINCLETLC